jgi:cupin fold WbuC family metalloprotein
MLKLLPQVLLDELAAKAAASPRARAHHNIHATAADPVQRFLVVAQGDSYFRPHRHASRSELALLLRGGVDVLIFDESGRVLARHPVGEHMDNFAYETPQGEWHTLVPSEAGCAFLEIKEGPYDPVTAVQFAAWSPSEGDAAVPRFRAWLRNAQPGDLPPPW